MSAQDDVEPVWEHVRGPAAPHLRRLVASYSGFRDDVPAPGAQRQLPSTTAPLIIDLGAGWRVATPADRYRPVLLGGFAGGMHDAFALVEAAGPALCLQADLTPLGARRLLGVPMHELTNRVVSLDDLLGPDAGLLAERIAGARTWPERFAIVDEVLTRRLERAPAVSPEVEWAWAQLETSAGAMPVGTICGRLGWSRKRLVAAFREEIGLTPKTSARLVRFDALMARLRDPGRRVSWARLAAECGYFDQSHLVRDVREFTGGTPTELLGRLPPAETALTA